MPTGENRSPPRVALLIESSRAYGRGLLRGIAKYARLHQPWVFLHEERAMGDDAPHWFTSGSCDGILARAESSQILARVEALGLPTVDLNGVRPIRGVPMIQTDQHAVAIMAADHLLDRGFQRFGYCGIVGANYSVDRLRYFRAMMRAAGYGVHVYEAPGPITHSAGVLPRPASDPADEGKLSQWLRSLPRPIGLLACNDIRGQQVLNACRAEAIRVPEEVAVLGVDNDELLCELSVPPMSSIIPNTHRIGYEAAAILDAMMTGDGPPPAEATYVEPIGVVTRASTDVVATDDDVVAQTLHFIRHHACEGIDVHDIVAHLAISRSTLERRFARVVGHSPKDEIVRVRLDRVKQLLVESDFTLERVAEMAGFKHHEYLSTLFRSRVGITPGAFRRVSSPQHARAQAGRDGMPGD